MSASIKVLTFNLRIQVEEDGINAFFNRTNRVLDCINTYQPDIIGFQEANAPMRAFLRENLKNYTVIGCGRYKNYNGESTPIAFRNDIFELISLDTFWLSDQPNVPGSRYPGDQSGCPRLCITALLKHADCERPFRFYNTHLDHVGENARLLESKQLIGYISEHPERFVLTGDFNALPDTPEIRAFADCGLGIKDVTANLGGTFHAFGQEEIPAKIDYIFTNAPCDESKTFIVPDSGVNGVYISDHFPVCTTVEME